MTRVLALAAITVLLGAPAATVSAQGTDFSGTWNLDRDSSELPQGRGGGGEDAQRDSPDHRHRGAVFKTSGNVDAGGGRGHL